MAAIGRYILASAILLVPSFAVVSAAAKQPLITVSATHSNAGECHFKHGLCVHPRHVKFYQGFSAPATVQVPASEALTFVRETDNCQGMATLQLQYDEGSYSFWTINGVQNGPTGTCYAKFTGTANGNQKVGPAKLRITILPS